jgi:TfoX/Sxy family transcriptional regulator of competence genes
MVPFDEQLACRIREQVGGDPSLSERKMFGGVCFMAGGNMCFGVVGEDLMVRVGPDKWEESLAMPFAREMDFTGRSMRGMVYVSSEGLVEDESLHRWLESGLEYATSLPPKL